jgi:hypothetical protein
MASLFDSISGTTSSLFKALNTTVSQVVPLATNIYAARGQLATLRNQSTAASLQNQQANLDIQIKQAQLANIASSQNVVSQDAALSPFAVTGATYSGISPAVILGGLVLVTIVLSRRAG